MIRKIIEIIEKICSKQVLTSFLVFLIIGSAIFFYTLHKYRYAPDFRRDVLVEVHGMALDILVIGTFLFALLRIGEKRLEKKRNIERWQEEIDDYRGWDQKEATYRIVGNIRRLNRYSITNIDLSYCYLKNADLLEANLCGAIFWFSKLQGADLAEAKLQEADFWEANLYKTDFVKAKLQRVKFQGAKLHNSFLVESELQEAQFFGAYLEEADLEEANLQGADLRQAKNLTIEQLSKVKTLYGAKLDPELEKEIREKYPHLLEKPEEETEEENKQE